MRAMWLIKSGLRIFCHRDANAEHNFLTETPFIEATTEGAARPKWLSIKLSLA
jgi:hypothetical protein